ncbi:MAG: GH92 family glycosyl hydrolase [Chitinophagales bacterium]
MSLVSILVFGFQLFILTSSNAQKNFTQYVDPFIGTGGHGHTFPGAVMPFGMVQLSPDTRLQGWDGCSGYHYSDSVIYGFSHTHLSGTGVPDYCDILMMPTVGNPQLNAFVDGSYVKGYASHFSHKNESASPGYYAVHLDDDNIDCEFTVTPRVGFHEYVFPETQQANIILDLTHRDKVLDSYVKVIDDRHIEGYRRSEGWARNQIVYFYAEFSKQMESFGIAKNDSLLKDVNELQGTNVKAYFQFHSAKGEAIYVKVAISQVSMEGAQNNLRECMSWDFEATKRNAEATWNHELSKIDVSGKNQEQKKIFYTALYHCMIHPSLASDADGKYLGRDFKVHQLEPGHDYYTVFSLWDTYRALHPLLTIIDQKRTADFINTFLLEYQQGGRLPVWELSSNETDCMIGYHSVSVITDAAMKGIKLDYKLALEAMKHSAELDDPGLSAYRKQGYISSEDDDASVSKTLEYSYDDWCISQMAKLVGDSSAYKEFAERGQYWKNIFDRNRGFMRPKRNGDWYSPFNPFEVNSNYTEANAWQYNFAVPQDIDGLISMMGGKEKFEMKLDSLFTASSNTSGLELPDVAGLIGQYAQGNEPSHHMAYLYDYCGAPWKTQQRVREIMAMYTYAPDGLIGNEDCGQMSAWYVMSAMGFYEVTPGYPYYAIGSPVFDTVKIHLENQKTFFLITHNNSAKNIYVSSIKMNSAPFDSILFSHFQMMNGGTLEMNMSGSPPKNFSPAISFRPSEELMKHTITVDPFIHSTGQTFTDSTMISLIPFQKSDSIYFATEGNDSITLSNHYVHPFTIYYSYKTSCFAANSSGSKSKIITANFRKTLKHWKISYITPYNSQYTGGGNMCLMDQQMNSTNFRDGSWQGWWGNDMALIVDLGQEQEIAKVSAQFLQDEQSWIMMPKDMEVEISSDGKNFISESTTKSGVSDRDETAQNSLLDVQFETQSVRYIKIIAHNYGKLPSWHPSAGENAWIFCDEIFIE